MDEMETNSNRNTEAELTLHIILGETVKENKIVLFLINCLLMLPFIIRNHSIIGIVSSLAILLILFFILFKSSEIIPASAYLPIIIVADVCCYVGVRFELLKLCFDMDALSYFFQGMGSPCIFLLMIGCALFFVGRTKQTLTWLSGIGGTAIGTAIILHGWSNCDFAALKFYSNGDTLLAILVLSTLLWTILIQFIGMTVPIKRDANNWIGIFLLVGFLVFCIIEQSYTSVMLPKWKIMILNWPHTLFSWWRVILATMVLLIGTFLLYTMNGDDGNGLSVDTYALILIALSVFSIKFLMINFFSYNWMCFLIMIVGTLWCMKNDYLERPTLQLNSIMYLSAQFIAFLFTIILLKKGLWINVIVTIVFGAVFYTQYVKKKRTSDINSHWVMILLCIVAEAAAWMCKYRFCIEGFSMIVMVLIVAITAMSIINLRHPNSMKAPDSIRITICVCLAILCLLTMNKFGAKISTKFDSETLKATIEIQPRGKKNEVKSACYYWRDKNGKESSKEVILKNNGETIAIQDEVLTIITIDVNGVQTTSNYWYPHWLLTGGY